MKNEREVQEVSGFYRELLFFIDLLVDLYSLEHVS